MKSAKQIESDWFIDLVWTQTLQERSENQHKTNIKQHKNKDERKILCERRER